MSAEQTEPEYAAHRYLMEDLRFAAQNFYESMARDSGIDIANPKVIKFLADLITMTAADLYDEMDRIVKDVATAEGRALENFSQYAGFDPKLLKEEMANDDG